MLQAIRDRAQGVIAWIIIILIIIPFALWGVNEYVRDDTVLLAAEVDDQPIPLTAYQRAYQSERSLRLRLLGNRSSLLDNEAIKKAALERVINAAALAKIASDAGYRLSDQQLAEEILNIREFQVDGRFDASRYAGLLNSLGMTQSQFEADLRQDLLTSQLVAGLSDSEYVIDSELALYVALKDQRRDFSVLRLPVDRFRDQVTITEDEVKAAYDSASDRFMSPERVQIDYIELSVDELKKTIAPPTEDVLRQRYQERQSEFGLPEERKASHILVAVASSATDEEVAQAREKAADILRRLQAGEDFAKLAEEFSDDPGSAKKGGDLGYFARGVMDQPFEEKVFAMREGEISEPVRSRFGFHIIRLNAIRAGAVKPFDEVVARLREELIESKAEEQFFDMADRLTDLAYVHPESLQQAADDLGVEIRQSDFFSREQGQGIAAEEPVRLAAFSEDVLENGNNSEPIELGNGRMVVLRVAERQAAARLPLADVEPALRAELLREKVRELTKQAGEKLLARLESGEGAAVIAKAAGLNWEKHDAVRRDDTAVDDEIRSMAFAILRPEEGQHRFQGGNLSDGGYLLVDLAAVLDGELDSLTDEERQNRRQLLLTAYQNADSRALLDGVKSRLKIRTYEQNL